MASQGPQLLEGLLANDIVGFHLPLFCDNFLRSAEAVLGLEVDWQRRCVTRGGRSCYVRAFPISIDVAAMRAAADVPDAAARLGRLRSRFARPGTQLGIGVDRIDYSKGLEEKLKALDLLWESRPELRERLTYVQIAVPSRTGIEAYDWLSEKLERMVWSINDRHGTQDWRPVYLLKESVPLERLALYYRAADLAVVSSLQDGMNLVAKEFVACQLDDPGGVLVLSKFAGAAEELDGAIEVNPFDPEKFANSIAQAILLEPEQRRERLARLHGSLRTIYDWMLEVFEVWAAAAAGEEVPFSEADGWRRTEMSAARFIRKKRDGEALTASEIGEFFGAYSQGTVEEYQNGRLPDGGALPGPRVGGTRRPGGDAARVRQYRRSPRRAWHQGGQAQHWRSGRQGITGAGAPGSLSGRAHTHDERAGSGAFWWHRRQTGVDSRLPDRSVSG